MGGTFILIIKIMELNNQQLNALARRIVKETKEKSEFRNNAYSKSAELQRDIDNDRLFQLVTKIFNTFEEIESVTLNPKDGGRFYVRSDFRRSFEYQFIHAKQVKLPYDIFEIIKDSLILDNIQITNIADILDKIVNKYVEKYLNN